MHRRRRSHHHRRLNTHARTLYIGPAIITSQNKLYQQPASLPTMIIQLYSTDGAAYMYPV